MTHRPLPEHPLQRQIADALRLEIAPPGQLSRDGVVWWSGSTTPAMGALHLALASGGAQCRQVSEVKMRPSSQSAANNLRHSGLHGDEVGVSSQGSNACG